MLGCRSRRRRSAQREHSVRRPAARLSDLLPPGCEPSSVWFVAPLKGGRRIGSRCGQGRSVIWIDPCFRAGVPAPFELSTPVNRHPMGSGTAHNHPSGPTRITLNGRRRRPIGVRARRHEVRLATPACCEHQRGLRSLVCGSACGPLFSRACSFGPPRHRAVPSRPGRAG